MIGHTLLAARARPFRCTELLMSQPTLDELFERRLTYPDFSFKERLDRLIGLDEYKVRLTKMLGLLVNPKHLKDWMGSIILMPVVSFLS